MMAFHMAVAGAVERVDSPPVIMINHPRLNQGRAVAQWLSSFKDFPPRQKPASFNLDEVMRKMSEPHQNK